MKLGTLELAQYVREPIKRDESFAQNLERVLTELEKEGFGIEALPKRELIHQKALITYPRVSPEFLRMHNEKEYVVWGSERSTLQVPRFGVYSFENPRMTINLGYTLFDGPFFFEVEEPSGLPLVLTEELARSSELFAGSDKTGIYLDTTQEPTRQRFWTWGYVLSEDIKHKFKKHRGITLRSTFHGIVPSWVREEVRKAKRVFSNNVYIVAETSPEEWSIEKYQRPRIAGDPIVIGISKNECFYVGKFNTTPLEKYVVSEFVEGAVDL
jgi:hypothetical protein